MENRLKVVGIGLNKTGTSSLREMLRILGYKRLVSVSPELISDIKANEFIKIDQIITQNDGFEDLPWPFLYRHINENFENVKFVLTLRKSPEKWYESLYAHIKNTGPSSAQKGVYGFYHVAGFKKHFIKLYTEHERRVKEYFKFQPDKLLTLCLENGEGILELNKFLGMECREESTPHINRRGTLLRKNRGAWRFIRTRVHDWRFYRSNLNDNFLQFKTY